MISSEALQPIKTILGRAGRRIRSAKILAPKFAAPFSGAFARERLKGQTIWKPGRLRRAEDGDNAWAGTTPVLGGQGRLAFASKTRSVPSGVVPAHAL